MTSPHESSKFNAKDFLWLLAPLVPVAMLMTWPVWVLLGIGWAIVHHYSKPHSQKMAERDQARAKHKAILHRIDTAVQMQLTAHGLPNTAENRALILTALSQDRSSGIGR